jgi:alanine racemase
MGRIGFLPGSQAVREIKALADLKELELEGCFTHFAKADETDETSWRLQHEMFRGFLDGMKKEGISFPVVHCANTAAGMRDASAMMNLYRAGIGVYGLYPSEEAKTWGAVELESALTWKSILSHVKYVPAGWGVSYGHAWFAQRDTLVGTVPVGYADGYSRSLSNKGLVLVRGVKVPVIGNICMDQFMVDLTGVDSAASGDEVVLIGRQGSEEVAADDLAGYMDTINYEIVCMIDGRIPRLYTDS